MTSILLVLLSQIDVYSAGVYQGRARQSVECLGCYVDAGRLTIPLDGGTGSGAPTNAKYIVAEANGSLSAEVAPASDDQIPVSDSSSAATWRSVPNCADTSGQHLNYTTASNSFSCGTSTGRSYLAATMDCAQPSAGPTCWTPSGTTPSTGTGDHVTFKEVVASQGSDITLDVSDTYSIADNTAACGRFTLASGKTYRATVRMGQTIYSSNNGYVAAAWFNADTGVPLGAGSVWTGSQFNASDISGHQGMEAVFTTSSQTRIEVRIFSSGGVSSIGTASTQSDGGSVNTWPFAFIEVL